jgi:hypothetical protein
MRNLKKHTKKEVSESPEIPNRLPIYAKFPKIRKPAIQLLLVLILMFVNVSGTISVSDVSQMGANPMIVNRISPEAQYVYSVKEKFRLKLVTEVENYITKMAPTAKLSSDFLVSKCLEYDTDIIFVLSQALLESHFGTKGVAAKTNSVWNVGTYDNGKVLYKYDHPDQSVEPYLKLLNEKYLINVTSSGDTIYKDLGHLVQDRGYINYAGNRFASARGYENGMRKLMVRIDMETSISFYQDIISLTSDEVLAYFALPADMELDYSQLQAMN